MLLTPIKERSRAGSACSPTVGVAQTQKSMDIEKSNSSDRALEDGNGTPDCASLEDVMEERKELERFLFEESNKINRPAIKFILEKWASMEARLQNALVENKILRKKAKNVAVPQHVGSVPLGLEQWNSEINRTGLKKNSRSSL